MEINKRGRSDLKGYFQKLALPTEANFAAFIDGVINQKDDGVVKPSGDPLSIQAVGDDASAKKVLSLYKSFADAAPEWTISLRHLADPSNAATAKSGLSVSDGGGASRLFIDRPTGNVGVGTIQPTARLHVIGGARIEGDVQITGALAARIEDWKPLTLSGAWVAYLTTSAPPSYCKDASGFVRLRGVLKNGNAAAGQALAALPDGYRPEYRAIFHTQSPSAAATIDVQQNGTIALLTAANTAGVSLDGIAFKAFP